MSWLLWAVGFFGFGTLVLIAVGFAVGWPVIVGTKIGRTALAVVTAGFGIVALYYAGQRKGRALERAQLKAKIGKEVANAKAEKARIDGLTDAQVDKEWLKWQRKS